MNLTRLVAAWLAFCAVLASGGASGQAASMDKLLGEVIAPEDSEEEIAEAEEALDEVVAESELERQRQNQSRRRKAPNSNVDFVTATRNSTRTGDGSISLLLEPYTPQREIRLRASDARQLAEGTNSRLELQRDRLTTNGSLIRSVTLEFTVGADEADGLPALIPINARTSLFNFDFVRLENSTHSLIARLKNAMDPETRRCASEFTLGIGAEDFHDRFVLLGNGFGDCDRTVNSREGDLLFAETVPQRLRQELHDLYDPVYNQFARDLGSEPGIVFVIWRPESSRNDFRLVRSLNRTSLLVFDGPSWEHGFTAQQRDALSENVAQVQVARRIRGDDAITEAAADYLLKLAKAERQHTTISLLTTVVPEWISACARAMNLRVGSTNASRGISSYDCGLVVQFVYDAVARAKSKGKDGVMRTWRTLLADANSRKQNPVLSSAFLDSSTDARRIVQGLLNGVMDWTAFAVELGKVGVQLRVTSGHTASSVEMQSLADFRD